MGSSGLGGVSIVLFVILLVVFVLLSLETMGITQFSPNELHSVSNRMDTAQANKKMVMLCLSSNHVGEV